MTALLGGCGPEPGAATTASLGRAWADSTGLELHWADENWDIWEDLVDPRFDVDPPYASPGSGVRVLIGLPDGGEVADLLARLPVESLPGETEARGRFRCFERTFLWREAVVVATIEDPARAGRPLVLVTSRHEQRAVAAVRAALDGPEPWRPRLAVFERGEVQLEVRLTARGAARVDTLVDHAARRRWDHIGETWDTDEGWSWRPAPGRVALLQWESALRGVLPGLAWRGVEAPSRMEILMAPTVDALVGVRPAQRGARYDPREHRLVWGWPATDGPLALAEELLIDDLGPPSLPWLGRAAALEAAWPGDGLLGACADLVDDACTLAELLDPAAPARSSHFLDPQRALLWRVAREEFGDEGLTGLWSDSSGLSTLAAAWDAALDRVREVAATLDATGERRELPGAGALVELPVAATGSLGSRACFAALERARAAGADAVLLRVHVAPPAAGEDVHALEGDAAVLWAVLMAHTFDLEVALSAEVLASPSGGADGERVHPSPAAWRAHFDWARRAVEHVALLAAESGAAALVLNGGGPEAVRTVVEPDMDEGAQRVRSLRDEGWREVVRAARRRFDGDLVLACARTEGVGFLADVDAVLVELFPASSSDGLPADAARRAAAFDRRIEQTLGAHPRTILEVGFRARANADAGSESAGGAADPEVQEALFASLVAALEQRAERGAPRPAGIWVRGFGSAPGAIDPRGFGIEGRPAAALLPGLWR